MLATDLLLLALDDERGTVLPEAGIGLDYGLAGAVVTELALLGRLQVDGERVSATGTATDDPLLDDALRHRRYARQDAVALGPSFTGRTGWFAAAPAGPAGGEGHARPPRPARAAAVSPQRVSGTGCTRRARHSRAPRWRAAARRLAGCRDRLPDPSRRRLRRHPCDPSARPARGDPRAHGRTERPGHRRRERGGKHGGAGRNRHRHRGNDGCDHRFDGR